MGKKGFIFLPGGFNSVIEELSKKYRIYAPVLKEKEGRFTDTDVVRYDFVNEVFIKEGLDIRAVKSIGSIDIKKDEEAIKSLASKLDVPFVTFTKDELNLVKGDFCESEFVKKVVGVGNVCERSVCIQCKNLIVKKTAKDGMTVAIGRG